MKNDIDGIEATERDAGGSNGWRRGLAVGGLAVAVVAGAGLVNAQADGGGWGGGWGPRHGGMHERMGGMGFMHGGMGRVLEEIDATAEQEKKIWAIIDSTRSELRSTMIDFRNTREDVVDLLTASQIDREAAEKLRSERVAALDAASQKMTAALLDVAEVLTPEQRAELAEIIEERRSRRGRW